MKKITLSVALFLTTVVSISATNLVVNNSNTNSIDTDKKADTPMVYQWYVKTTSGVFAGTASSLEQANNKIANAVLNNKIISKDIQAISLKQNVKANKIYTWGASTSTGFASGTCATYEAAEKMLNIISKGDAVQGQIIESYKLVK